jgi:hypothetical protein
MVKNVVVPVPAALPKHTRTVATFAIALFVMSLAVTGCGRTHPPQLDTGAPSKITTPTDPTDQLAGLAAAALDRKYVAAYAYRVSGQPDRTIIVSIATDHSWSVNVPGGALNGGANVSVISDSAGIFQCVLGGPATTLAPPAATPSPPASPAAPGSPSPTASPTPPGFTAPVCIRVAKAGGTIPSAYDPVMEHIFTDWLTAMSSRDSAISVFGASALPGSSGICYSVEPSAASLAPVVDAGIFCFQPDGTLSAVKLAAGSLTLMGTQAPPAPTNALPAPLVPGPPAPAGAPAA